MATYVTPVAYRNASGGVDISGISVGGTTGGTIDGYTVYWGTTVTFTPSVTYKYSFNTSSNPLGALLTVPAASFIPALPGTALYFKYTHNVGGVPKTTYSAGSNVISNTNVTAVIAVPNTTTGDLDVSWNATALAGATYNVGRNTVNTGTPTTEISGVSGTTATITPPNGYYYVAVQATFGGTVGAWVYSTARYYAATVPGTVTNFVVSNSIVSNVTVPTISWTAPSSGYTVSGTLSYTVDISSGTTGGWTTLTTTASSATYTLTAAQQIALIAGTPYFVRITPKQSVTLLTSTTVTASTIFGTVTDVSASNDIATGNITISWSALAGATSYEVVYSTVSTIASSVTTVTDISGTSTVISGLSSALRYFAVKANFGIGYGGFPASKIVNIIPTTYPSQCTNVVISNSASNFSVISWTAPTRVGYTGSLTYKLDISSGNVAPWTALVSTAQAAVTYTLTSAQQLALTAGVPFYVRIVAINGAALTSSTVSSTAIVGSPSGVAVVNDASSGNATVSWNALAGATGYKVRYSTVSTMTSGVVDASSGIVGTSYTVSGLTLGTRYYYAVQATFGSGYGGNPSTSIVNVASATYPGAIVASVTANTATSISFSWPTPSVGYSGVLTYRIVITPNGGSTTTATITTTTSGGNTLYTRPSLVAGTAYSVYFTATNVGTLVSTSNTVSSSTLTTAPTSVIASKASNTSIAISFTPPTTNGVSITSYTVTPYISGVVQTPLTGLGPSSPITISSLESQIGYKYTIAAVTSIGTGTASAQTAEILLPLVSVAGVPSNSSYACPTATETYANSAIVYTDLSYGQGPVVAQISPRVWTVAYGGFTDTLTNVKTVIFTDISGLFVDLSYGVYGSLMSQAHNAARNVGVGGDIIYIGAGTFVELGEDAAVSKSVIIQGGVGPGPSILQNSFQGPTYSLGITGNNITVKNLTLDNSNLSASTTTSPGYLMLGAFNYSNLPPGQTGDASRNLYPLVNFVCDSCIFTNALTSGLDPTGSSNYNRRGVSLQMFDSIIIRNCTFPKAYDYGLILNDMSNCTISNCTFYACQLGSVLINPSNSNALYYTTTNLDISDPSNNFIDISAGTYVNSTFGGPIVPTSNIVLQPYSLNLTHYAPYTFGTTGTPDVKLPASMDYAYMSTPTVVPSQFNTNRAVRKRYTSDQVYLESTITAYSWYGYQFSTGNHIVENRFNPIPLLNNLPTATPEGSTVLNPHVIEFQLQSDVLLLTDTNMSDVSYNQVVVISDDVSGTYIYNSNVATTLGTSYTNNLFIVPNTIPNDLSSNPYLGVNPSALVSVTTVSGDPYTYSSDTYLSRLSTEQQSFLPAVRGQTWYASSYTERSGLLTGPEKAPFAPTVDLLSGDHSLTVTWSDNSGGAPTTMFITDVSSTTNLDTYQYTDPSSGTYSFTIINNGTYIVTVTATNVYGTATSAPQSVLVATVPSAPTEEDTTVGSDTLIVNWTPNDDGGSPILGYKIYWYDASTNLLDGSANDISSSPYTITGLTTGKTYDWAVSATNAFGEGAQSPRGPSYTPSVPPGPPTDVIGTRLDTGVSLTWNPPIEAGGSPILYYNVYDASTGLFDVSSNGNNNTVNVTGLTNGQSYSFYVKAVNIAGEGVASDPSAPVIPAGRPIYPVTGLYVDSVGDGTITLKFDAADAIVNGAALIRYNIFQSIDNISFFVEYESPTNTFTVTGLTNGLSYWFKASIENEVGEGDPSASVGPTLLPISVTLSFTNLITTYNGGSQAPTVSSTPPGVQYTDVALTYRANGEPFTGATDAGSYDISATLTNPVYSGADVSGTFVINQAALTITADDHTRNYWIADDISNTAFTRSALIGSDSVTTVTITSLENDISSTPVGVYIGAIVPSDAVGTGLNNYDITYLAGNLTIVATLPDTPMPIIATHTATSLNISWNAPVNTGDGNLLYYTLYYCKQSDLSGGADFFTVATDVSYNVSDLGGINNISITSGIEPTLYVFSLSVTNTIGPSVNSPLFYESASDYTENIQNAAEQITLANNNLGGQLTTESLPAINSIIEGAGMVDYSGLETFRDLSNTSLAVYVYSEAQAITQIGGSNLGVPQNTTGTQAEAVLQHMYASAEQYPGSVTPELLNDLSGLVASGTPFWLTYAEFVINVSGEQIAPYPVIDVESPILSIIPMPHFIEIKFYLNVISSTNPNLSGQVLLTRDASNMIIAVEPGPGTANVSLNVPASAGANMVVTLDSGPIINVAIPGLADTTATSSPDAPTDVTAVQNGSSIIVSWDNPINPYLTSYTISETLGSGFSVTISAPATRLVINTLSVIGPYRFEVVATNSNATTSPDSPPGVADYSPSAVPCFPAGTRILTPSGYRAVENLVDTDLVQTADGRAVPVKLYKDHIANPSTKDAPYLVPAHSYGRGLPPADLRLSPLHAFQTKKGLWHVPRHAFNDKVVQYGVGVSVDYYHVECPNYFTDNLVVDGCIVESFAGKQVKDVTKIFTFVPRYKALIRSNGEGNRVTLSK